MTFAAPTHSVTECGVLNGMSRMEQKLQSCEVSQVVMAFLIGMGDEPALKYRILPVNRFMNIGEFRLLGNLHM